MDDQQVAEILTKATSSPPTNTAAQPIVADFGEATMETIRQFMAQNPLPRRFIGLDTAVPEKDNVVVVSAEENYRAFRERLSCSLAPIMVSAIKPPEEFPVIDHIIPRGMGKSIIYDFEGPSFDGPNANGRMYPRGVWKKNQDGTSFPVELLPEKRFLPPTVPPWLYERDHVCALEEGTPQEFSDNVIAVMEDSAYRRAKRIADVLEKYNIRVKFDQISCDYLDGELRIHAKTSRTTHQLSTLMTNKKVRECMWGSVVVIVETADSKELNGSTHYHYAGTTFVKSLSDFDLQANMRRDAWYPSHGIKRSQKVSPTFYQLYGNIRPV